MTKLNARLLALLDPWFAPLGAQATWALLRGAPSRAQAPASAQPESSAPGGLVRFQRSGLTALADGTKPLLQMAEELGLNPSYGCRKGLCHSCGVPLVSGRARHVKTGVLSSAVPGGNLQLCIYVPAGELVLDL